MVTFLIDASLPRSTAQVVIDCGHAAIDVRDVGLGTADDERIASHARSNGLAILTADFDFADVRAYPPESHAGIVVVDRPPDSDVHSTLTLVRRVLSDSPTTSNLQGRLVIVDRRRIRVRPALLS